VLTPEEWVRQHIVHYFINQLKYPKSLIRIEGGLKYNQLQKRSDVVIFERTGKPWLLLECKSPNGLQHVCYEVKENVLEVELLKTFPEYP
jgi:hypothetical protein